MSQHLVASSLDAQELTYDGLSRVTTLTDGNNKTTTYTYDNLNQVLQVTYTDKYVGGLLV